MSITHITKRLAITGVVTALAAAGIVGVSTTTTYAATASTDYTCAVPLIGSQTFPVTITSTPLDIAESLPAGITFPAGALDVLSESGHAIDMSMTAPAIVVATLAGLGTLTGVSSPDLAIPFGPSSVPVEDLALTGAPVVNPDGSALFNLAGSNGAFTAPPAGAYDITLPSAFTFVASTTNPDFPNIPVNCTSAAPPVLKHLEVTKNASTTVAKAPAKVHKGKVAKLVATVTGGYSTATGKVTFMDGSKKLGTKSLNDAGKAVFKAKGLKVGKHKVTAKYLGDGYRAVSTSKVVKVMVIR